MKTVELFQTLSVILSILSLSGCGDPATTAPKPEQVPTYEPCRTASSGSAASCGTGQYDWEGLIPGPKSPMHDGALAAKMRRYDRLFQALNAHSTGLNTELAVTDSADQVLVANFAQQDDGWNFETFAGKKPEELAGGWSKVAGAYAGVGVAADAFRYATLRDQAGDCKEIEVAREHLKRGIDGLFLATEITGKPGVIARGFIRTDVPGGGSTIMTTPLFDENGNPLPVEKNNGTWREDQSGQHPNYIWEDSCSRDQLVGWAMGYAATWEVIADDPSFEVQVKTRLQNNAKMIVEKLMVVGKKGYDLEIPDADGRVTYHGYLNENSVDRSYLAGIQNGFMSMMATGIVAAFAYVAEDPYIYQYLYEELGEKRRLHELARDSMILVDLGAASNFSNYNMAFLSGLLAYRYHCDGSIRSVIAEALATSLYDRGKDRQPKEQKQTLYDFTYVLANAGSTAYQGMQSPLDVAALQDGLETLQGFPDAPFWNKPRINCDDAEIMSGTCIAEDGSNLTILGPVGHNDELVAKDPLPIHIRPPSNYYWRSNPYAINGEGDGTVLLPGVDMRFAYWLGRFSR